MRGGAGGAGGHQYLPTRHLAAGDTPPRLPRGGALPRHPRGPIASPAQEADPIPLQVDAKVTLGLGGVAVVLGAVMAAMGLFAYLSVPSSLVVLQVVPFLVLAVGADNIFIFVLEYQVSGAPCTTPPDAPRWVSACSPQMPRVDLSPTYHPVTCTRPGALCRVSGSTWGHQVASRGGSQLI